MNSPNVRGSADIGGVADEPVPCLCCDAAGLAGTCSFHASPVSIPPHNQITHAHTSIRIHTHAKHTYANSEADGNVRGHESKLTVGRSNRSPEFFCRRIFPEDAPTRAQQDEAKTTCAQADSQ